MFTKTGKISNNPSPTVLLVIDGWDISVGNQDKRGSGMPYLNELVAKYPTALLKVSEDFSGNNYHLLGGIKDNIAEIFEKSGLKQIKISTVEKYADLVFFFNGKDNTLKDGEERILVKTEITDDYALRPKMSTSKISDLVIKCLKDRTHDLIIAVFANLDLVSSSGNQKAILSAKKAIDTSVNRISKTVFNRDGRLFISSTGLSRSLASGEKKATVAVPFIMVSRSWEGLAIESGEVPGSDLSLMKISGTLADVAPTILKAVGYEGRIRGKPLLN